ncbi:MAG: hypothetical protein FGM54_05965 [Chitinophagaceae bacterium]|nr:hypothetical protein [Chitinophagaceae bacterium]
MKTGKLVFVAVAILLTGASCGKIIKALLQSFTFNAPITVSIPVMPVVGSTDTIWLPTFNFNVDSIIKAQSGGSYDLNLVDDVQIEDMQLTLTNTDANNNISNFSAINVLTQTNAGGNWGNTQFVSSNTIPDVTASTLDMNMSTPISLLSSLKNNQLRFGTALSIRRASTMVMEGTLNLTLRVK